jgi:hypothetical protein
MPHPSRRPRRMGHAILVSAWEKSSSAWVLRRWVLTARMYVPQLRLNS